MDATAYDDSLTILQSSGNPGHQNPTQTQPLQIASLKRQNNALEERIRSLQARRAANEAILFDLQNLGIQIQDSSDREPNVLYNLDQLDAAPTTDVLENLLMPECPEFYADLPTFEQIPTSSLDAWSYNFSTTARSSTPFDEIGASTQESSTPGTRPKKRKRLSSRLSLTLTGLLEPVENGACRTGDIPNTTSSIPAVFGQQAKGSLDPASEADGNEDLPPRRHTWSGHRLRKSVEISVKTLARGFDKVRV